MIKNNFNSWTANTNKTKASTNLAESNAIQGRATGRDALSTEQYLQDLALLDCSPEMREQDLAEQMCW